MKTVTSADGTVIAYDRTGDTAPFAPDREYEDLAAVAAAGTEPPFVFATHPGRRLRCALPPRGCLSRASLPTRRRSPTTRPRRRVPTRPPASANWSPRGGNAMRLSFG